MNLAGTQIKDTYGNLITIGSVAGTPTTGTLQNGAGSDITSLTLNGAAVFNEGGGNFDFRVEGDTDANLLFVDANTDKVGIGTNAPAVKLEVADATSAIINLRRNDGTGGNGQIRSIGNTGTVNALINLGGGVNNNMVFENNGAETMRFDSSNRVGIGTTSPSAKLDVVASPSFAGEFNGTNTYLDIVDSTVTGRLQTVSNVFNVGTVGAGDSFAIKTEGIERVRVANTGSVGIGTSLPTALLDVRGSAVFNESGADVDFRVEGDTDTHLIFADASADRVGIGKSSPIGKFNAGAGSSPNGYQVVIGYNDTSENYFDANNNIFRNGSFNETARITSNGNLKIGGSADRATTEGTRQLVLFNGTAPVGTLANGVSFYSASGEANVMDAAGNATLLSPHDKDTNEWIFRSKHTPTGKVLKIDVERMLRFINDHFGLDMIEEFTEA